MDPVAIGMTSDTNEAFSPAAESDRHELRGELAWVHCPVLGINSYPVEALVTDTLGGYLLRTVYIATTIGRLRNTVRIVW